MVGIQSFLSQVLTCHGKLQSADTCAREAVAIADALRHANARSWALYQTGLLAVIRQDWTDAFSSARQALELALRHGLKVRVAQAKLCLGLATCGQDRSDDGVRLLRDGYAEYTSFAGRFFSTVMAADAAEALLTAGRRMDAVEFISAGEKTVRETGEQYQDARFTWLRGQIAEADGDRATAQADFQQAMTLADQQGSLLILLRSASSYARLCQSVGQFQKAELVLRPVYEKFTEGLDYPDLIRARALLGQSERLV